MKILILGCGWVGHIFAQKRIQQGDEVFASTTSPEKLAPMEGVGMKPYLIDFGSPSLPEDSFLQGLHFDLVFVSVPAKKREEHDHCMNKFERLALFLQSLHYHTLIYLSSVGIYPATGKDIHEMDIPVADLDKKLYQAEQILRRDVEGLNILRLGGIFGHDRIPGKHFSNKLCAVANQKANYIHVDDIAEIVMTIYRKGIRDELFNVVSPHHPEKKEVILAMANKYHFALPSSFENTSGLSKTVSSQKLIETLHYRFLYPHPADY